MASAARHFLAWPAGQLEISASPLRAPMQLKGKTAIVTGSTSGIGLAIAHAVAAAGANVVINGLGSDKDNEAAIRAVAAHGPRVAFDPANMLRCNQIADLVAKTEKDFDRVDILGVALARASFSRTTAADLVQRKGFGSVLCRSR
jgi:NAD(P)-dependent dehydrogenase (short-subunit alcohol dehydrogenase family)